MSGLFAAWRLLRHGIRTTVVERAPGPGGLLAWTRVGSADLEIFYHHLFANDRLALDALSKLGVPVDWQVTRTGFVGAEGAGPGGSRVAEFSGPQDLLTFSYLSLTDRVRLGAALARVSFEWLRQRDVAALDEIPAGEWVASWGGARIYERFFDPLIHKKYGSDTPDVSAAWLVGRLGMRAGRGAGGERLGYPRGGFRALVHGLAAAVSREGGELRYGARADRLLLEDGRVRGLRVEDPEGAGPEDLRADAVLTTSQPRSQVALLERSGADAEVERMRALPYQGAFTVLLGLERPLTDIYWINIMDAEAPFGAVIEHTNFAPVEPYGGPTVYLASYPDPGDPLWEKGDDEVIEIFGGHLRRLFESARDNPVRWAKVARTNEASLIYRCGVARLLPPRRAPLPGLYYSGMFRVYPKRPINLVGGDACATADTIAADLSGRPAPAESWLPDRVEP